MIICGLCVGLGVGGQRVGSTANTNLSDIKRRQFSLKSIMPLVSVYIAKVEIGTIVIGFIVRKLDCRDRFDNDVNALILLGIVPLRALFASVNNVKLWKSPIDDGNVPDNPLDFRSIDTTLAKLGDPLILPQVTPSKEHHLGRVKRLVINSTSSLKRCSSSSDVSCLFKGEIELVVLHTLLPGDKSGNKNASTSTMPYQKPYEVNT